MKDSKQDLPYLMRFKFISVLCLATILAVVAISCKSALYVPSEADASASVSLKQLQAGRLIYVNRCGSCHSLYLPEQFTPAKWRTNLNEMKPKAKLTDQEYTLVYRYLCRGKE